MQFGSICMVLSHRINRTRNDNQVEPLVEKFYLYWGLAVRALNEQLESDNVPHSDWAMAGVLALLFADIQHGVSLNWRCHLDGLYRLIELRGGFKAIVRSIRLTPLLFVLWPTVVIANTTCPASDITSEFDELQDLLEQLNIEESPLQACPSPLFAEIIKINQLRGVASQRNHSLLDDISQQAYKLLDRIDEFSPKLWIKSKAQSKEDWLLVAEVYQASIRIYCILSLQSLRVLPKSRSLRTRCLDDNHLLHDALSKGLSRLRTSRLLLWPLVVLGVEAAHGDLTIRQFVSSQLQAVSRNLGIYLPLLALQVLDSFWQSGAKSWDACFDKPYAFTTQIAVDCSRLQH
ncbi:hypothetical protein BT63DRAFT_107252 [Microthyrium microscopicum]|uniref:Transcription factor domain-containing protein n=1 Tax=Microthyrium microscopicum TaxID=703497 RepID=A0A6A6TY78_9PEZI|nr:hypothetical protein BT63DRAFT_107252 [Microthyrium microscopicum]